MGIGRCPGGPRGDRTTGLLRPPHAPPGHAALLRRRQYLVCQVRLSTGKWTAGGRDQCQGTETNCVPTPPLIQSVAGSSFILALLGYSWGVHDTSEENSAILLHNMLDSVNPREAQFQSGNATNCFRQLVS